MRRRSRMLAARRCATVATRFLFLADEDVDDDRQFLIELFLFFVQIAKKGSIELDPVGKTTNNKRGRLILLAQSASG